MKNHLHDSKSSNYLIWFGVICLAIIGISFAYYCFVMHYFKGNEGIFGDQFGGLNALFSGFAFAGVIVTILLQMKELELTRDELKKSAEAQEESQKALNLQLKQMQLASKIDAIKKLEDSYISAGSLDKIKITKSILEKLTEDIFYSNEFLEFVSPHLEILPNPLLLGERIGNGGLVKYKDFNENEINHIKLSLFNSGASCEIKVDIKCDLKTGHEVRVDILKQIQSQNGGMIQTNYVQLPNGNLFERNTTSILTINNITREKSIKIEMQCKGELVKHTWVRSVNFEIKESKLTYKDEGMQKINTQVENNIAY